MKYAGRMALYVLILFVHLVQGEAPVDVPEDCADGQADVVGLPLLQQHVIHVVKPDPLLALRLYNRRGRHRNVSVADPDW